MVEGRAEARRPVGAGMDRPSGDRLLAAWGRDRGRVQHPDGALGMFNTLAELGGGGQYSVFEKIASTHPATQERIANAKAQIASMQPLSSSLSLGKSRYQQMLGRLPAKKEGP